MIFSALSGPNNNRYRDDLDNNYDDDDANPGSLMPTEASPNQREEEETSPAPKPYRDQHYKLFLL